MTWFASTASENFHIRVGSGGGIQKNVNPHDPAEPWVNIASGTVEDLYGVAWSGFNFLAVGAAGTILRSNADATTWTPVVLGYVGSANLNAVAADNPVYIFCGDGGLLVYSSNGGLTWTEVASGTTESLNGVDVGNAQYIAVGDNETVVVGSIVSTFLEVAANEVVVGQDTPDTKLTALNTQSENMELVDSNADKHYHWLTENLLVTTAGTQANWTANALAIDFTQFNDRLFENSEKLSDSVTLSSGLFHALGFSVSEVVALNEDLLVKVGITIADAITIADNLGHNRLVTIEEQTALQEALKISWFKELLDSIGISDQAVELYRVVQTLIDSVDLADSADGVALSIVTATETVQITDMTSASAVIRELLEDGALFGISLAVDGDVIDAWVINAHHYGASRYEDFNFTSMASSNMGDFAIGPDGVYMLEDSAENTNIVSAYIDTGSMDFETGFLKNVNRVYLGLTADGKMGLKTITDQEVERWYELMPEDSGMHQNRVKLHKGVKSMYWQFRIHNIDGSDFELESLRMPPIILNRRTKHG